jgi:hypothetical protein
LCGANALPDAEAALSDSLPDTDPWSDSNCHTGARRGGGRWMNRGRKRARRGAIYRGNLIAVIALFVAIFDLVAADRKFAIISALIGNIGVGEPLIALFAVRRLKNAVAAEAELDAG